MSSTTMIPPSPRPSFSSFFSASRHCYTSGKSSSCGLGTSYLFSSVASVSLDHDQAPLLDTNICRRSVEIVGYIGRAMSATETPNWSTRSFTIQSLTLLLGPALLAASIYMVLGRLIRLLNAEHLSPINPKWLTKLFVLGDVLSFLTQGGGKFTTGPGIWDEKY